MLAAEQPVDIVAEVVELDAVAIGVTANGPRCPEGDREPPNTSGN